MKTVNKYILASSVFCYFAGLFLIAQKMGMMRFVSNYGLSRVLDEWPADFPSLHFIYIFLAVYTLIFAAIIYIIFRHIQRYGKDMDQVTEQTTALHDYDDRMSLIVSRYKRLCREHNIVDNGLSQRLTLLEKQIAALPASVLKSNGAGSQIERIIGTLDDAVSQANIDKLQGDTLNDITQEAIEEITRLRKRNTHASK